MSLATLFRVDHQRLALPASRFGAPVVYYVLAAAVGFQSLDAAAIADADRRRVLADLLR